MEGTTLSHWSLVEDPTSGTITVRLPEHFSASQAVAMTIAVKESLLRRASPVVFVADLLDVRSFDSTAPMIVVRAALGTASLIERADIFVRNSTVRAAAISIAHVLHIPFTVWTER